MMVTLNPYLVFDNNCEEAFNFYKQVFEGNSLYLARYKDVPQAERKLFPMAQDEKIMHATLQLNAANTLMGCDRLETSGQLPTAASCSFYLYVSVDNQQDAYRIFEELSAKGKITMPISRTFWATHYGMVIDKFGIHWKITCAWEG